MLFSPSFNIDLCLMVEPLACRLRKTEDRADWVDNVWQGSKVQVFFLVRSTFTLLSGRLQETSPGECGQNTNNSIIQMVFLTIFQHVSHPALSIMVELAFYPAVALIYFFGVMGASKEDRVELDNRASINVFCLFVLVQPLCLVFGGYKGMAAYLLTALISYNSLPWKPTKEPAKRKESKKKKWEPVNVNKCFAVLT